MPTYEYGCPSCGHQWEEVQRITEPATQKCPKCSQLTAHRLISGGTNFILKGGGWYSDLYSSSKASSKNSDANGGGSSDTGSKAAAAGPASPETKSESKSEPKPSPAPAASSGSSSSGSGTGGTSSS
jgi:putative FmdB family regulatory protein